MAVSTRPVPWEFHETALGNSWTWTTEHFLARIQASTDNSNFSWSVNDLTQGRSISIGSGMHRAYTAAESDVRELIGKSYPIQYGYRVYAGSLATTFRIYTGEKIDFSSLETARVRLTLQLEEGKKKVIEGTLRVFHHKIRITDDGRNTYEIEPSYILVVQDANGKAIESLPNPDKPDSGSDSRNWLLEV